MDSFEWNKIAGAVLGTVLFVMVVRIAGEAIFATEPPAKEAYHVEGVETANAAGTSAAPVEEPLPDWAAVIPKADTAAGQTVAVRCQQCHDLTKAGPNKIGPNLWGIVGRARGTHPGFSYSSAMAKRGGEWSYDDLFHYIHSPAKFIPGNKMAFAGVPKPQDRINLIAYLRTLADSPAALPAPRPAAPAPASPAAGGAGNPAAGSPGGAHPPTPQPGNAASQPASAPAPAH